MAMGNDIKTPLYQKVGEDLHKVLVETSADQVLMKDAENGDSNVQAEIESLRESVKNVLAANDAMIFKGVVAAEGDIAAEGYNAGWTYKVGVAGTYKGQKCEVGDLIVCVNDYAADGASDADWTVVQTNIDGAVTGPESAVSENLAAFDGTTGRIVKDSALKTADVADAVTKRHEHANKAAVLDKLSDDGSGNLLFDGKRIDDGKVDVASTTSIDTIPANLRDGGLLIVNAAGA